MEAHQLLPNFVPGDAVSNHARTLGRLLRSWSYRSEIYAHYAHAQVGHECRPLEELPATPRSAVIYHYSTLSAEAGQALAEFRGKKAIIYHNITPPHFYAPYCDTTCRLLREARAKVWANAIALNHARREGPDVYAARLAQLEELSAAKVADLRAPGQVLLKLAATGFGVRLSG